MTKQFHLGWFTNWCTEAWNETWGSSGGANWDGQFYVDLARQLDRSAFDFILIEDKLMVSDAYGGTAESELRHALHSPKLDPIPLVPLLASATSGLGFIPTVSTTFTHPFNVARSLSTLDHITHGRIGWNVVTSAEDRAAQNFGFDKIPTHADRYERAAEFLDLTQKLWRSWEPDAVIRDVDAGVFVDHRKVHTVDHEGKYFKSRGPLNVPAPPQLQPVIAQAGGSEWGKDLAARYADVVVGPTSSPEKMKEYRDDVRERATKFGRNPDDVKILFLVSPFLGDTDRAAWENLENYVNRPEYISQRLGHLDALVEVDFSRFDLDEPLPDDLVTDGESTGFERFIQRGSGKTLRELVTGGILTDGPYSLTGSPETVADRLQQIHELVGGDGFLFVAPNMRLSRRYITEVLDGLVPVLQRRGLVRREYRHNTLRENLREF
jgi:FMN-dependent oxidoreductase (nitrilotriacetate monooxygenase family)